jgi:hypothetical protein
LSIIKTIAFYTILIGNVENQIFIKIQYRFDKQFLNISYQPSLDALQNEKKSHNNAGKFCYIIVSMNQITFSMKIVIFGIQNNQLMTLLHNNRLIDQAVKPDASLDNVAKQIFSTVTQIPIKNNYIEQLYTMTGEKNEVSVIYYVLLPETNEPLNPAFQWQNTSEIPGTTDDFQIIQYAIQRLQWKIEYTNIIYSLLPQTFTLTQLQTAYEIIFKKTLDKRNFRKKILSLDFLEATNKKYVGYARPAKMYRFKMRKPVIVNIFS